MTTLDLTHPELAKEWHPRLKGSLKPSNVSGGSGKKVWWLCPKTCDKGCFHEYQAIICNRSKEKATGCPYCSGRNVCICNSITITHPELVKEFHPTLNGKLMVDKLSKGSNRRVWWLCDKITCNEGCQHVWEAVVCSRTTLTTGCPHCSNHKRCEHQSLLYTNPDIAKQWHPTLNEKKVVTNYHIGSAEKVWWLCDKKSTDVCTSACSHEWKSAIQDRKNNGCPFCSIPRKQICKHSSLSFTHPHLIKELHPTLNGALDINKLTCSSSKKLWWICSNKATDKCTDECSHTWQTSVAHRTGDGTGCPYCTENSIKFCEHSTIKHTHPNVAAQWHPQKNGNLDIKYILPGSNKKVWWLCHKTCSNNSCLHEWQATVNDRTKLNSPSCCPYCSTSSRRLVCEHDSIKYTHPKICEEWHVEKNGAQKKEQISFGSDIKIWWQCQKNTLHTWKTSVLHRTKGHGCPLCLNKTEDRLDCYLKKYYPLIIKQYKLDSCKLKKHLPFDFCIPELKVIIELDGGQHFRQVRNWMAPEKAIKRDVYKMQKAEKEGYKIIRVFQEDVYNNDESWIEKNIMPEIISADRLPMFISSIENLYDEHIKMYQSKKEIILESSDEEIDENTIVPPALNELDTDTA